MLINHVTLFKSLQCGSPEGNTTEPISALTGVSREPVITTGLYYLSKDAGSFQRDTSLSGSLEPTVGMECSRIPHRKAAWVRG